MSSAISKNGFISENVRYEFAEQESRLDLTFSCKAVMHVVWPVDSPPFSWIEYPTGMQVTTAAKAKTVLRTIGIVPTLTPIEHSEKSLSDEHVRANFETKLASRHFRNQLSQVQSTSPTDFQGLVEFLLARTPELSALVLRDSYGDGARWLDVYYTEQGARTEKELFWAGDGLQIWLQVLFHIWRNRAAPTIVLDEPDVFLHPDLQRRLIHVLEDTGKQSILATHAPEMASEAHQGGVVWVERGRTRARRVTDDEALGNLTSVLGSGFNLSVARALRSKVALFVEGEDMKILRLLAKKVNADKFAEERGLTVIPIGGFSHWPSVEAFSWLKSELLGSAVEVWLLLDRDYRSNAASADLVASMADQGVLAHVWKRKELESYLLEYNVLAKLSGLPVADITSLLDEVCDTMKHQISAQYIKQALEVKERSVDVSTATAAALTAFDSVWGSSEERLKRVPAKDALSALNLKLQGRGISGLNFRKIAGAIGVRDIDTEMTTVLKDINLRLS